MPETRSQQLMKSNKLSPDLAAIVGKTVASRIELIELLWAYLKENKLECEDNDQFFLPDKKMGKVFGTERIQGVSMAKHIQSYLTPIDPDDVKNDSGDAAGDIIFKNPVLHIDSDEYEIIFKNQPKKQEPKEGGDDSDREPKQGDDDSYQGPMQGDDDSNQKPKQGGDDSNQDPMQVDKNPVLHIDSNELEIIFKNQPEKQEPKQGGDDSNQDLMQGDDDSNQEPKQGGDDSNQNPMQGDDDSNQERMQGDDDSNQERMQGHDDSNQEPKQEGDDSNRVPKQGDFTHYINFCPPGSENFTACLNDDSYEEPYDFAVIKQWKIDGDSRSINRIHRLKKIILACSNAEGVIDDAAYKKYKKK